MTIVHIEEVFHPAYGYQVQNFCRHHSHAHSIHVVTSDGMRGHVVDIDSLKLKHLDQQFTHETGAEIHRLPVLWNWHHKTWLTGLHKKLRELEPDVIYAHGVEYLSLPRLLFRDWDRRCLVVADSHDMPTAAFHKILRQFYKILVQNWCVRQINRRQITCYYTALPTKDYLTSYGIDEKLQRNLPIGTSAGIFYKDAVARDFLRKQWGVEPGDIVLLYTGKHDRDKTPHVLYEAMASIPRSEEMRIFLVSVGARDNQYCDEMCAPVLGRLRKMGVKVIESAAVPSVKLRDFYSASDIGVFPCRNTLSCLDAMACGLPVIMQSDITNNDRLQVGGLVYEVGNTADLTCKIQKLIIDPNRRETLSREGMADMNDRFEYSAIVARLEADLLGAIANRLRT